MMEQTNGFFFSPPPLSPFRNEAISPGTAKSGHGQTAGGGGKQASIEARKKKTKTKQRRSSGGNDLCLSSSICGESIFHNRIAANRNKKKLPIVSTR